jgi:hypothetical protein
MAAWLSLEAELETEETLKQLRLGALCAQGDPKAIREQIRALEKEVRK